jgi:hypothetical protein
MQQLKVFIGLVLGLLCIGLGFLVVGWWMLLPIVVGVLWNIAGDVSGKRLAKPAVPHPTSVASAPSKPASTVTWQETVERIERERLPLAKGAMSNTAGK